MSTRCFTVSSVSVLRVSEDEDDSEAGGAAIVIAWLIARRAVPWAEVQAAF